MAERSPSGSPLAFSCNCGALRGQLEADVLKSGTHVACFCTDCRAAELYFGQPDPAPGPLEFLQTTPDKITLTKGAEHLGLFRLGPNGLFRWYATCCNTPLFNTLKTPKLPFVGLPTKRLTPVVELGPITARHAIPNGDGTTRNEGVGRAALSVLVRMFAARLSGRWRQTPFFDIPSGQPVSEPVIPSKEERAQLLK